MFGFVSLLLLNLGLYILVSIPFTETEYIGIKCLAIVLITFYFLNRKGSGFIPTWFSFIKIFLDPLVSKISTAARKLRDTILL